MRGLAEKIWNVLAPSSAALIAAFSSDLEMEVWMPEAQGNPIVAGCASISRRTCRYKTMRSLLTSFLFAAALLLSACARARVTTQIQSDGSWTRTVALTGQQKTDGFQLAPTLEDTFVIPAGSGWKSTEEVQDNNRTLTLERTLPAGAHAAWRRVHQKFRTWQESRTRQAAAGEPRRRQSDGTPSIGISRDAALDRPSQQAPGRYSTGGLGALEIASSAGPGHRCQCPGACWTRRRCCRCPFCLGQGDPLLAVGLLHPDLALYRANQRIGAVLVKALEQQFGEKMQPAERRECRQATHSGNARSPERYRNPIPPPPRLPPPNSAGLTPLMFIVKPPGRVVSTNGEIDGFSGEIFWALFEEAADV